MSFSLPSYLEGDADLIPLRDHDTPEVYDEEKFSRAALGKFSIMRANRSELIQKNILKERDDTNGGVPGAIGNRGMLSRRLSTRPTMLELKLRNILRTDSEDFTEHPDLEMSIDFEERKTELKSSMKKRVDRSTPNLLTEWDDALQSNPRLDFKTSQSKDSLMERKTTNFNHTVEVYSTFKKQEYNRKPDENATFRKLTPQMKVQIREELNTFKKTEMEVHEESAHNTCFH